MYLPEDYRRACDACLIPPLWSAVRDMHGVIFTGPKFDMAIFTSIKQGNA